MTPKRNLVKIIFGIGIILITGVPLVKELKNQANTAQMLGYLTMAFLFLSLGFYLLYRGLYPREK
jgi:hypothetical protein